MSTAAALTASETSQASAHRRGTDAIGRSPAGRLNAARKRRCAATCRQAAGTVTKAPTNRHSSTHVSGADRRVAEVEDSDPCSLPGEM